MQGNKILANSKSRFSCFKDTYIYPDERKEGEKACPLVAKQGKVKVLEMRSGFLHASTLLRKLQYLTLFALYFMCVYFILPYLLYSTVSALQTSILGVCNDQI